MLIAYLKNWLTLHIRSERGQDLIEYAMLGGLVAAAILGAVVLFGGALTDMATGISNCIDFKSSSICGPF